MLKLLLRAVHNVLYTLEGMTGDVLVYSDKLLSDLTLGARGATISSRLWQATQPTSPKWQRIVWGLPRRGLDMFCAAILGKPNHTEGAYNHFVAEQKPA